MKTETKQFPLLTLEKLAVLERKVDMDLATLEDLELIDHYLTSINKNDIHEELVKEGLLSLEEYLLLLKAKGHYEEMKAIRIRACLWGGVHLLQLRVKRGDKIY